MSQSLASFGLPLNSMESSQDLAEKGGSDFTLEDEIAEKPKSPPSHLVCVESMLTDSAAGERGDGASKSVTKVATTFAVAEQQETVPTAPDSQAPEPSATTSYILKNSMVLTSKSQIMERETTHRKRSSTYPETRTDNCGNGC